MKFGKLGTVTPGTLTSSSADANALIRIRLPANKTFGETTYAAFLKDAFSVPFVIFVVNPKTKAVFNHRYQKISQISQRKGEKRCSKPVNSDSFRRRHPTRSDPKKARVLWERTLLLPLGSHHFFLFSHSACSACFSSSDSAMANKPGISTSSTATGTR